MRSTLRFGALALGFSCALAARAGSLRNAPLSVSERNPERSDVAWVEPSSFCFWGELYRCNDMATGAWYAREETTGGELTPSRTAPDGGARAVVEMKPAPESSVWSGGVFTQKLDGQHELRVERGDTVSVIARVTSIAWANVYWSPDGKYVAWLVRSAQEQGHSAMVSPLDIYTGSAGGVRIAVLTGRKTLAPVAVALVRAALKTEFTPVSVGTASKSRATSVVFAAEGFEDAAQRAVALVPGGATVEPLTWKADAELVIALGESALPSPRGAK